MTISLLPTKKLTKNFLSYSVILLEAVKRLSFTLKSSETFNYYTGANRLSKSIFTSMLLSVIEPIGGEIIINGHQFNFGDYSYRSQRLRMIFQDPSTSLTPRQSICQFFEIPLILNTSLSVHEREESIEQTLQRA